MNPEHTKARPLKPLLQCLVVSIIALVGVQFIHFDLAADGIEEPTAPAPTAPGVSSRLPQAPAGFEWVAIPHLSDEFDSSSLDPKKWQPDHPYWSGREPSRFSTELVSIADGHLQLRARSLVKNLAEIEDPMTDVWVESSCVSSRTRSAGPGYYECRFRASRLSMTSSFWLQGKQTEIDVVEQIGAPIKNPKQATQMLMNTHFFEKKGDTKVDHATPEHWTMPTGSADAFHTYGVWWRDTREAWFYHNGKKVAEIEFTHPFDEPMFLFFDTEVFTWAGLPTLESLADPTKNVMSIDWVRSWELRPLKTGTK